MAAFNKFNAFVQDVYHGEHNFTSDSTCTITVALSNAANAPSASADSVLADVTQISYTNVVTTPTAGRVVGVASSGQTSGTYKLVLTDMVITATGGAIAAFRYPHLYNDDTTTPDDALIGWYDYTADLTLAQNETLTLDFDGTNGVLTHA